MSEAIPAPSVWSLPWQTLRLAGHCFLPLVMWYSGGQLLRFGLLVGGTELSHGSMRDLRLALTMLVFIVMVMTNLIVSVGMFYTLRGSLPEMRARRADGAEDEGFVGSLSRVIIPFVALYLSWGWHLDDVRAFLNMDIERQSGDKGYLGAWSDFATGRSQDTALGLISLNYGITLTIMIVAFLARYFLTLWHERSEGRAAALAVAFCELTFFYYGAQVISSRAGWVGGRAAYSWWTDFLSDLKAHVPGWEWFWGVFEAVEPYVWDAVVLPAAWLTVAILMYGAYADDARAVIRGTLLEAKAAQAGAALTSRTHALTRRMLVRSFGGWTRWVALAHTVRLAVRGGAPLFGLFTVCFAAIKVGEGYATRGLEYLVGTDHPLLLWNVLFVPIDFVVGLGVTLLTTCLLAATFDIAARSERRRRAQGVSDRIEEPARFHPFPGVHSATAPTAPGSPVPSVPRRAE